jgi:hypothetical protein
MRIWSAKERTTVMGKSILCLDFDGVCHLYTSGWKGADVIPDPPVPGLFEFILAANKYFDIHIFSSRSGRHFGQMTRAEATPIVTSMLHFPTEKPPALIGLDDRVLTFNGKWPSVDDLVNFQPWNKNETAAK